MRHECPNCGTQFDEPSLDEMEEVLIEGGYNVSLIYGPHGSVWGVYDPYGDWRKTFDNREDAVVNGYERAVQDRL